MLAQLGEISFELRREVRFDARTERFGCDDAANRLLGKSYRAARNLLGHLPEIT